MEINEGGTVDGDETGNGRYDGTHHSNEQNRFGGFLGSWCEPCRMIAPVLDQLASEMKDERFIAKKMWMRTRFLPSSIKSKAFQH